MGKTKTSFVSDMEPKKEERKSSFDAYKEKKEKQKAEEAAKVHVPGLKGGQKVKVIEAELPEEVKVEEEIAQTSKKVKEPKVRSKNYQSSKGKVEAGKLYSTKEAVKLVKETSYSKFGGGR